MRKKVKMSLLFGLVLELVGCNGGSNSNPGSTANSAPIAVTNLGNTQLSSKHPKNKLGGTATNGSVGWNSTIQGATAQSCWEYTPTLSNSSAAGGSSAIENLSQVSNTLGIDTSVQAKFGSISSGSSDASYNQMRSNVSQQVTFATYSDAYGTISINVTGLSKVGSDILNNSPAEFYNECGDQVLLVVPVKTSISYMLSYSFESQAQNASEKLKINAASTFVDAAATISSDASNSASHVSIQTATISQGNVATPPTITACTGKDFNAEACANQLSSYTTLAQQGYQSAQKEMTGENWQGLFAFDYSRMNNLGAFKTISSSALLTQLGYTPPSANTLWGPYKKSLIHNLNVLQDLITAKILIDKQIVNGINYLPTDFAINFTPYPSNILLANAYKDSLDNAIYAQQQSIVTCLNSATADISTNCSAPSLDPDSTVLGVFNANYTSPTNVSGLGAAIGQTIQGLIYADEVISDGRYPNPQSNLVSTTNSYMVYLPANSLWSSNGSRSPYVLVTVPASPTVPTATISGTVQNIYLSAYEVAGADPTYNFWGSWDSLTQSVSGAVGFYEGYNEILIPSTFRAPITTVTNTLSTSGINGGTCTPYNSFSQGCIYTITQNMDPAILYLANSYIPNPINTVQMSNVTQSIVDSYDSNLAPSNANPYGNNQFATLYPF